MAIQFPSNPSLNQTFTTGSKTWSWNGYAWDLQSANTAYILYTAQYAANLANSAWEAANSSVVSSNSVVNSLTSNTYISVPYTSIETNITQANTAGTQKIIDSFNTLVCRSVKYTLQVTSQTDYQVSEILLLSIDNDVMMTEYGLISSSSSLGEYSANVVSGIAKLYFTPNSSNNVIVAHKTRIANTQTPGIILPI